MKNTDLSMPCSSSNGNIFALEYCVCVVVQFYPSFKFTLSYATISNEKYNLNHFNWTITCTFTWNDIKHRSWFSCLYWNLYIIFPISGLPPNRVIPRLKQKVTSFKQGMPVITSLRNSALRTRHWEVIQNVIGTRIVRDKYFTLGHLLQLQV